MKKGKCKWIIVNPFGNYWDGKGFAKSRKDAKEYLTHGKCLLALELAKSTVKGKFNRSQIKPEAVTIAKKLPSFQEWLETQD